MIYETRLFTPKIGFMVVYASIENSHRSVSISYTARKMHWLLALATTIGLFHSLYLPRHWCEYSPIRLAHLNEPNAGPAYTSKSKRPYASGNTVSPGLWCQILVHPSRMICPTLITTFRHTTSFSCNLTTSLLRRMEHQDIVFPPQPCARSVPCYNARTHHWTWG